MQSNSERMAGCVVAVNHNHLKHMIARSLEFGVHIREAYKPLMNKVRLIDACLPWNFKHGPLTLSSASPSWGARRFWCASDVDDIAESGSFTRWPPISFGILEQNEFLGVWIKGMYKSCENLPCITATTLFIPVVVCSGSH